MYVCTCVCVCVCMQMINRWPMHSTLIFDKGNEGLVTELLPLLVTPQNRDFDDEEVPYEVAPTLLDKFLRRGGGSTLKTNSLARAPISLIAKTEGKGKKKKFQ